MKRKTKTWASSESTTKARNSWSTKFKVRSFIVQWHHLWLKTELLKGHFPLPNLRAASKCGIFTRPNLCVGFFYFFIFILFFVSITFVGIFTFSCTQRSLQSFFSCFGRSRTEPSGVLPDEHSRASQDHLHYSGKWHLLWVRASGQAGNPYASCTCRRRGRPHPHPRLPMSSSNITEVWWFE